MWFNHERSIPAPHHVPAPSRTGVRKLPNVPGPGDRACTADGVSGAPYERAARSIDEFAAGVPPTHEFELTKGT